MIAVDTNVLVRIFIDDAKQMHQVNLARQFAKKHANLFVPQIVQVELVWVLDFSYELSKSEIISILRHLEANEAFALQHEKQFAHALNLYESHNASFADCIIFLQAKQSDCDVVTFDKKFSKLPGIKLLN